MVSALVVIGCDVSSAQAFEWLTENFIDPEDGALDLSKWIDRGGFLPVPIIVTEPAVENGLGLAGVFVHGNKDDPDVPPNLTGAAAVATGNGSWLGAAFHQGTYLDDRLKYVGAIAKTSINLDFYGQSTGGGNSLGYNIDGVFLLNNARYRLGKSEFWAGGRWTYLTSKVGFTGSDRPDGFSGDGVDVNLSGLGASLYYDTRDNIFTPSEGVYARALATRYDEAWGSNYDFSEFGVSAYYFHSPVERWDLGLKGELDWIAGDAPFFAEPFISLRGIPALRYQGEAVAQTEIEARYSLSDRWSVLGFTGVGLAADRVDDFGSADPEWVYGAGVRYLIARELGFRVGLDLARGPEETVVYLQVGHAWQRD